MMSRIDRAIVLEWDFEGSGTRRKEEEEEEKTWKCGNEAAAKCLKRKDERMARPLQKQALFLAQPGCIGLLQRLNPSYIKRPRLLQVYPTP